MGGNLGYAICQGLILIALAHLGGPEPVGQFSFALALVAPIMLFFQFGLRTLISTDSQHDYDFKSYLKLNHLAMIAGVLVALTAALIMAPDQTVLWACLALIVSKVAESFSELYYGVLQRAEMTKPIAISLIIRSGLGALAFIIIYAGLKNLTLATMAYALVWCGCGWFYDRQVTLQKVKDLAQNSTGMRKESLKPLFAMALPMGVTALLISMSLNLPRLFLGHTSGDMAAVGYFSSLAYLVALGGTLANAAGQSISPRLAKLWQLKDYNQFNRISGIGLSFSALLGILGFLLAYFMGEFLVKVIFGPSFTGQGELMIWIAGAAPFLLMGNIGGYIMYAMRAPKVFTIVRVSWMAIIFIACLVLIPTNGLWGAVGSLYVLGLSNVILVIGAVIFQRYKLKI